MKWVIGSVAVLFAFVAGVATGWVARARAPGRAPVAAVASTYSPPPPLVTAPPVVTVPPFVTAPPVARRWKDDDDAFAWPSKPPRGDVVALDATHYVVREAFERRLLENHAGALPRARLVPVARDGGVVGVRVYGIRPSSMVARIGLENGDTVESLNGVPLGAPDDALAAYTHLRDAKKLALSLERRGAPLVIHYLVVP